MQAINRSINFTYSAWGFSFKWQHLQYIFWLAWKACQKVLVGMPFSVPSLLAIYFIASIQLHHFWWFLDARNFHLLLLLRHSHLNFSHLPLSSPADRSLLFMSRLQIRSLSHSHLLHFRTKSSNAHFQHSCW